MAPRTPAAAIVLRDGHLEVGTLVWQLDVAVGAPDRQLPADIRLDGVWLEATAPRVLVQGAAGAGGETRSVLEDAGPIHDPGLELLVFLGLPTAALAGRVVLPFILPELGDCGLHPRRVVLVGEVRAQGAAAVVGAVLIDPCATAAENAGPGRREPGQVATETLVGVSGVGKLDPHARDIERGLWHSPRLCRHLRCSPR